MATGTQGRGNPGNQRSTQGGSEGVYDQATEALSDVAERASDMWDEAYDQGARYYREGSRAVGNVGTGTLAALMTAGAVGYMIAWMIHGEQSSSGGGQSMRSRQQGRNQHRRDYR